MTAQTEQMVEMATEIKMLRDELERQRVLFEEASQKYYRVLDEKKTLSKELEKLRSTTVSHTVVDEYKSMLRDLYNAIDTQKSDIESLITQNKRLANVNEDLGYLYNTLKR